MSYPQVRLVSAPTSSATVLFDFNDDTTAAKRLVLDDGFSLGVPELVGDVDAVDPLYGPRTVSFTLRLTGTKANALAAQSALARRLLAGQGWLQVRLHSTSDLLFFRTYRAQPGDLSFERVMSTATTSVDDWDLEVNLPCEAFAYGERVILSTQTINNDAVTGTYPMRITLPTVLGDAPSPLRVALKPNNRLSVAGGRRWMLTSHTSSAARTPIVWPIGSSDGFTAQGGTGAGVANVAYSGGTYRPVSFASPGLQSRLQGIPASPIPAGRYKVLLRVARSDTTTKFTAQFGQTNSALLNYPNAPDGPVAEFDYATTPAGFAMWMDLGDHQLPYGYAPPADVGTGTATPIFNINMGLISGTGSAHLDTIMLVPIEVFDTVSTSRFMFAQTPNRTALGETDGYDVFDGDLESHWKLDAAGTTPIAVDALPIEGSFPSVTPGAANVLTVFQHVDNINAGDGDKIGATTSAIVSYHPRWLWIGDS